MKILVTGGAGFVGSNICELLVERGHEIVALDNFFLGRKSNLEKIKNEIDLIEGSITDEYLIQDVSKGIDVICSQAAASSSPMFSMEKLRNSVSTNVDGFLILLKAAVDNKIKRVVYASTSSIYGNLPPPLHEDMTVIPPNFYAASKIMNEYCAIIFSQMYGLETVGFRYMSVYGPHEESKGIYANLVSQFLWGMQKGQSPEIYGNGNQTRDFVYAKDVARANVMAIESKNRLLGDIFNVGTGRSYSLNQLVDILNKILETSIRPKHIPMPVKNYIAVQQADISKIKKSLGWEPRFSLEDGIMDILKSG